tara:strand:+ start:533 stop:727 length:195 start_codon:yes stop_codon:yes gene_type:complete
MGFLIGLTMKKIIEILLALIAFIFIAVPSAFWLMNMANTLLALLGLAFLAVSTVGVIYFIYGKI